MNKDYVEKVLVLESNDFPAIAERLSHTGTIRLLHGAVGVATEAAEMLDVLKKHAFYGKPIDTVNLVEEIGDCMFYLAVMLNTLGVSPEEVAKKNMEKLEKRYGNKFSSEAALNRDLSAERKILES